MADYSVYRPSGMGGGSSGGRFRLTPQSRRFVIDNVPPEALPSELAAFLNIPLESSDTKLEMAMDMRTGMCKGVAFVTLPHSKSNNLMWSNGRAFLGHRLSIQLDDPFPFEKHGASSSGGGAGGGFSQNGRGGATRGMDDFFGPNIEAANEMLPGLGDFMQNALRQGGSGGRNVGDRGGFGGRGGRQQDFGGGPMRGNRGRGGRPNQPFNRPGGNRNRGPRSTGPITQRYHLIDIGAILTHGKFAGDEDATIERAKQAGVKKIVMPSLHLEGSKHAQRMAKFFQGYLYYTVGVHPHNAKTWKPHSLTELEELAMDPQCVAIGEIGLDFNRNFTAKRQQIDVFDQQVQLACRLQKPLLLHERDAFEEMNEVLNKYQAMLPPCVIHCFTGTKREAIKYLQMGYYLGITGYIWKDQEDGIRALLKEDEMPIDKLLLETDAPFMFPFVDKAKFEDDVLDGLTEDSKDVARRCMRGRNEPCTMPLVCELVAAFMGKSPEEVAYQTTMNAHKFFRIPMTAADKESLSKVRN